MADRTWLQPRWSLALILLAAVLVFLPATGFEFITLDDNLNVVDNGYVTDPSLANILHFWQGPHQNLYIPLTYTLWALLVKLSALAGTDSGGVPDPHLFHTVNLFFHLASTAVVFAILRSLVKELSAATLGALLFAIHPVQVEPVAWVTGLKDVLCGWWSLLALWLYILYAKSASAEAKRWRVARYGLATLCFCLALLSKPVAVVLPLLAGAIGLLLLERQPRVLARELLPWLLCALPVILVTKQAQPDAQHLFIPTLWQRVLVAGDTITFYLTKLLLPLNLAADYGRTPQLALGRASIYATGLLPYLLAVIVVAKARGRILLAAIALFILPLAPVLGFITFDLQNMSTVADRYLYLAILGPVLGGSHWLASHRAKTVTFFVLVVVALLGLKSAVQVRTWQDSITFYQHTLAVNPRSWTASGNLGHAMAEQHQPEAAIAFFQQALAAKPDSGKAYVGLGNQYRELNRPQEAIAAFRKALEYEPNFDLAYKSLGDTYLSLDRKEEAIWAYQRAVLLNPDPFAVHLSLVPLYQELSKGGEGIALYQEAIGLHPNSVQLHGYLGFLLNASHRREEAIAAYQRAIALDPGFVGAYNDLGNIYTDLGDHQAAITAFTQAIAIDPDFALAYGNLARVHLALAHYQEAVRYADQARALGLDDPDLQRSLTPYR